jgi:hypothetical protein
MRSTKMKIKNSLNKMEKEKFKISIIDFMPHYKKFEVGKYKDGSPACLGDCVRYNGYRYEIGF